MFDQPFGSKNEETAQVIGNALGSVVYFERSKISLQWGNCLRIHAIPDLMKPLLRVLSTTTTTDDSF